MDGVDEEFVLLIDKGESEASSCTSSGSEVDSGPDARGKEKSYSWVTFSGPQALSIAELANETGDHRTPIAREEAAEDALGMYITETLSERMAFSEQYEVHFEDSAAEKKMKSLMEERQIFLEMCSRRMMLANGEVLPTDVVADEFLCTP